LLLLLHMEKRLMHYMAQCVLRGRLLIVVVVAVVTAHTDTAPLAPAVAAVAFAASAVVGPQALVGVHGYVNLSGAKLL
jgi:hypothetical protein